MKEKKAILEGNLEVLLLCIKGNFVYAYGSAKNGSQYVWAST